VSARGGERSAVRKRIRLGNLLVDEGAITNAQLETALAEQKKRKTRLGRTVVDLGYVGEEQLLDLLARHLDIPLVDLRNHSFDRDQVRRLPEVYARRFRAVVLDQTGRDYLVGMADPTDLLAVDEISRVLKRPIRRAVVRELDLLRLLDLAYRRTDEITNLAEQLRDELVQTDIWDAMELEAGGETTAAPVAKLLSSLFEDAMQIRASDIHVEPDESGLRIRQRVDGVLQEHVIPETRIAAALVQRLKLISGLDISEKRIPQDGRFAMDVKGRHLDVRISTMPVLHGESVVLRLLDATGGMLRLDQLGLAGDMTERLRAAIGRPHGMILVTGPTGSGKTTTLYAALSELNVPERKIITVEDPVEYRIPRLNQVQIHHKIDLTFTRILRAALRQDPDILMVGEIRDQETAAIALRAAMTGHLVLSTLHTNDSITASIRLLDMGAEGFLVASSLRAVVAQRLVRRICDSCAEPRELTADERNLLTALSGAPGDFRPVHGRGCAYCNETGYRGRIGVYELLDMDAAMADAMRRGNTADFARAAAERPGFRPLVQAALDHARAGLTSLEEVVRVASEID